MTKQRRSFTPEFKREAACLVLDQGYSHIEAARSLGVVESALRRWVKQLQEERVGVTPKSKALTPEQQKIQELEARIDRLEREKAILKKATALLMSIQQLRWRPRTPGQFDFPVFPCFEETFSALRVFIPGLCAGRIFRCLVISDWGLLRLNIGRKDGPLPKCGSAIKFNDPMTAIAQKMLNYC